MMLQSALPIAMFALVATITPGGATTLATASGARFGFRRSIPLIVGITLGLASLAAASAVGLASLILAAPVLQTAMKVAGSIYLLWLAWMIGKSGPPHLNNDLGAPTGVIGGACLLWLNPKGWAMTLSAAASFATLADEPIKLAALLGAAFAVGSITSLTLWCLGGLLLARLLRTDRQWRTVNAILGLLLAASILPMWWE
jgi:threonine/homoserine/homoserine lactone efflux protein